jgi:hypothetical protein
MRARGELDVKRLLTGTAYVISEDGRVYSRSGWRGIDERELRQTLNSGGYPTVHLTIDGKRFNISVHRLVAAVFLPPRPSAEHEIRHLDGNKRHSAATNLAWGTPAENAADRKLHGTECSAENGKRSAAKTSRTMANLYRQGGHVRAQGTRHGLSKLTDAKVVEMRGRRQRGERLSVLATDYGVSENIVSAVCRGKRWTHV